MKSFTITEINTLVRGEVIGHTTQVIIGPEQLEKAESHHITFIGNRKYALLWETSKASIAIINENISLNPGANRALIKVKNADLAMAKLLELFDRGSPSFETDIHSTAVVHKSAKIGSNCKIGANSVIMPGTIVGENSVIGALSFVKANTHIPPDEIWAGIPAKKKGGITNASTVL